MRQAVVKGLVATAPSAGGPAVWLRSTQDCDLRDVRSPGARTLARLSGGDTARVRVVAGAASPAPPIVLLDADVAPTALRTQGAATTRRSEREGRRAAGADPGRRLRQVD